MRGQLRTVGVTALLAAMVTVASANDDPQRAGPYATVASVDAAASFAVPLRPETMLLAALEGLARGDLASATAEVETLVEVVPDFRLAQLVLGDLRAVATGLEAGPTQAETDAIASLFAEARQRVAAASFRPEDRVPAALLQLAPQHHSAIVVDASLSRLYLFQRDGAGEPVLVADYYATVGSAGVGKQVEGDLLTPLGVYRVVQQLPGEGLPDRYGPLALPVDYPNAWDRRHGRTGSGIWLHGVPSDTYSRPPLATEGCVAISNDDLLALAEQVEVGSTPVLLADRLEWVSRDELAARRSELAAAVERWRSDWASRDADAYLAHYAEDFASRGMDLAAWSAYKRRVNGSKDYIEVALHDLSILAHPAEPGLVVTTFAQDYRSDSFASEATKQLYWRRGADGRWLIVLETTL